MSDYTVIYDPPELPDPDTRRVGTILLDKYGDYWELSGWVGREQTPSSWHRMNNSRVRHLRRKGRIA